jgi:hypothetical protein
MAIGTTSAALDTAIAALETAITNFETDAAAVRNDATNAASVHQGVPVPKHLQDYAALVGTAAERAVARARGHTIAQIDFSDLFGS